LLNVINVNTKYAYVVALKDKTQDTVLHALERIRQKSIIDGRPLKVLQTDNGKEFTNKNTPKETPRSTATELDKVRNFESEKRNKLITAQDELDTTQELLNKNTLEENRSTSVKKTEERLLNMVKIQEGNLERATAAWRLAHEVLKETEARLRAGSAVTPTATTDRPSSAAAPRPHFMALSFLRCP
jgi:hypothetical protein